MKSTDIKADIPELKEIAKQLDSWTLTREQSAGVELLLNGGYAPLAGFMTRADYESVLQHARLGNGSFWPLPVLLETSRTFAEKAAAAGRIVLRDPEGLPLAIMTVEEAFQPDPPAETSRFGRALTNGGLLLGGGLTGMELPPRYDFPDLWPGQVQKLPRRKKIIGVQTRGLLHRRQHAELLRAAARLDAGILIFEAAGGRAADDARHYMRVQALKAFLAQFPKNTAGLMLSQFCPAGHSIWDLLLHAVLQGNFGCSHFMLPDDEAGRGSLQKLEARILDEFQAELPVTLVPREQLFWSARHSRYAPEADLEAEAAEADQDLEGRLLRGEDVPDCFTFPEVAAEIRRRIRRGPDQGAVIFFTGLSGSGKSSIAGLLLAKLMESGSRSVTLLDGDLVRRHLSSELGFSREDRNTNILRIGYVAGEIARHGGLAICAPIAPYADVRRQLREQIAEKGHFIEVYVKTPLAECEKRDRKGLYAKARQGLIKEFTGISDPYEVPENPDLVLDTLALSPAAAAEKVLQKLAETGLLPEGGP